MCARLEEEKSLSPGFLLCPTCGELFSRPKPKKISKAKQGQPQPDARADLTPTPSGAFGQPRDFSLGHKLRADTLRLVVPGIASRGDDGIRWAWSFVYAIIQGAVRFFEVDEQDLEVFVLTKTSRDAENQVHREVLDILWIDRIWAAPACWNGSPTTSPGLPLLPSSTSPAMIARTRVTAASGPTAISQFTRCSTGARRSPTCGH